MNIPVKDGAPFVQQVSGGLARARVEVRKTGENRWDIDMLSYGQQVPRPGPPESTDQYYAEAQLSLKGQLPESLNGTQTVKLTANSNPGGGPCFMRLGVSAGNEGSNASNEPASGSFRLDQGPSPPQKLALESKDPNAVNAVTWNVQLISYTYAPNGGPASTTCRASGSIEFIE